MKCIKCGNEVDITEIKSDYRNLFEQADFFGIESLTEDEQCITNYQFCMECIDNVLLP